ncbi:MAG: O-antigen ligase family protein [Rhodanobacteraceae bacterium]|nr:O-antigen ligase family protein [Rhodanobacteraceae bacterium]MBP9155859.1 O-antigen ligase family protein [Xanthomonadales bacterium]
MSYRPRASNGQLAPLLIGGSFLGVCVLAGGGTRQGLPVEAMLQLLSLPLIVYAGMRLAGRPLAAVTSIALVWFGLIAAWIAAQIIPLPPGLWTRLGGRDELLPELLAAGVPLGWHALSLDPDASLRALLALLPPFAIGLLALGLHGQQRVRLLQTILVFAIASAVLGLAQLAGGPDSPLRWHAVTNAQGAVGPFANRNHLATLLVISLPLATAQMINAGARIIAGEQRPRRTAALTVGIVAGVLLLLSLAMVRSRAGVVLAGLAAVAAALMLWHRHEDADQRPRAGVKRWLALAGIGGLVLAVQFGFWGLLQRFDADPMDDLRWTITRNTLVGAEHFGPLGVGAGGFIAAYQSVEPATDRQSVLINRAHNDWAEWWLEGGWPLAILPAAGLLLLLWRTYAAWKRRGDPAIWQRAAAIGLWLILLHSLSDYPLRTTAIACVAAMLLAHLVARDPNEAP